MDKTLRRLGQSKFIKVLLAVVLVLGLWPAGKASAASSYSFTSYELGYNLIQDKSWTISSNNAHDTTSGEVAYCYTWGNATPTTNIGYTAAGYANNATAVIIDYGYPNNTKINGVQLTSTEARQATQVAIWCVTKGKNNKQWSTSDLEPYYAQLESSQRAIAACEYLVGLTSTKTSSSSYPIFTPTTDGYQTMLVVTPQNGYIKLTKTSSNETVSSGNSNYSLAGAVYGVYSNSSCTTQVTTLTTGSGGTVTSGALTAGTYYVKETTASPGYALDTTVYTAKVSAGGTLALSVKETPLVGYIAVNKSSANTAVTNGNSNYTLSNAIFGVYKNSSCTNLVTTITTNENGEGVSVALPLGTYYVKETTAPAGYMLDTTVREVVVSGSATSTLKVSDTPYTGQLSITKMSANADITDDNGCYSLEGAVYGVYSNKACTTQVTTLTTDAAGYAISGMLPLGTYYVKEINAPKGYELDEMVWSATVSANITTGLDLYDAPLEDPDFVSLVKIDSETDDPISQGKGALSGAQYTFDYYADYFYSTEEIAEAGATPTRSWVLETNALGQIILAYGEKYFVSGDAFYYREDGAVTIPLGTVVVYETKAPEGYQLSDKVYISRVVNENGTAVTEGDVYAYDGNIPTDEAVIAAESPNRGDLVFTKVNEETKEQLAGVAFRITSKTTGEAHIVVTDANGSVDTSANHTLHSYNTNGNDALGASEWASGTGVWFGEDAPNDAVGALLYDEYLIEELACPANEGLQLVTGYAIVTKNGYTVSLGTINDPVAHIATSAADALDGDKNAIADEDTCIIDTVSYSNLIPGNSFTVVGTLMDKATGEPLVIDGKQVTAQSSFTATSAAGSVKVAFEFDASDLGGREIVVFEKLYDAQSRLISSHEDIEDTAQTVTIVDSQVSTNAVDGEDGDHQIVIDPSAQIVDTVTYTNLIPHTTYTVVGTLMDKETGEVLVIDGTPVTAQASFTAAETNGSVEVSFRFDASELAGRDVVVFEKIYKGERVVADHADLDDANQTVTIVAPVIGTNATDALDGDHVITADPDTCVIDTVSYTNLIPGKTYELHATLMLAAMNEPLTIDGKQVTASVEFTPRASSGTVNVAIDVDSHSLAGRDIVVFEKLYREGVELASHADINDANQTVTFVAPVITTLATDVIDDDHVITADPDAQIVDTVSYTGVVAGKPYELHAVVMDQETGEALVIDGEQVMASVEFTPEATSGTVEVAIDVDTLELAGKRLVVFEKLYRGNAKVAQHANINDEGQTVEVVSPIISTSAADAIDGDSLITTDDAACIVDTVSYTGVVAGKPYELHAVVMDQETGEALTIDGEEVTASVEFTPETTSGTVEVAIDVDALELAGKRLVVFEKLYRADRLVTSHEDIEDTAQTVVIVPPVISTCATDFDGDDMVIADPEAVIIDTVSCEGVVAGQTYTVAGTLMDKETGEALVIDGDEVTASVEFTPEATSDIAQVVFSVNTKDLAGKHIVVFEKLYREGVELASHEDIDDEGQTVEIIPTEIDTFAADGFDGDKTVVADEAAVIVDTLSTSNAIANRDYLALGLLINQANGLPILTESGAASVTEAELVAFMEDFAAAFGATLAQVDGRYVFDESEGLAFDVDAYLACILEHSTVAQFIPTGETEFSAERAEETIEVTYEFDASDMEDTTAVVYEFLFDSYGFVASHTDLDDEDQAVEIVRSVISTCATDATDGDHKLLNSKNAVIVDTVSYTNLIPGMEYTLDGVLMDKASGKPLTIDDKQITASARFSPNKPDGEIALQFELDASALANTEIVVFETLTKDGIVVADHADINDANQTVKVVTPPSGTAFGKTGADVGPLALVAALGVLVATGGAIAGVRIHRKSSKAANIEA